MKHRKFAPTALWLAPVSLLSLALPALADEHRWYILQLDGRRAGYMHEAQTTKDGNIVTTEEVNFVLARMGQNMTMTMGSEFVETPDGKPVSMSSTQNLGIMRIDSAYRFTEDGIEEATQQAGKQNTVKHPKIEGEWLTPAKAEAFVKSKLSSGEKSFTLRTVDPSNGLKAFTVTNTVLDPQAVVEAEGKTVPAVKWESTNSLLDGVKNVEFVDTEGRPVRSEITIGGLSVTLLATEKEIALSKFTAPEMMAGTTISPDRPLINPREIKDAFYLLRVTDGVMPKLPVGGHQRVTPVDEKSCRVKVDLAWPVKEWPPPTDVTAFTKASRVCDSTDPQIIALVKEATATAGDDKIARAHAMRDFVNKYIQKKSLAVGFATATEVARTKQGDCSEHAVLLAAMLRADGIPSRVVSGLIYAESFEGQTHVFGYHMWTQALLTSENIPAWLDYDAVLPTGRDFDATHIALTTSSLADDDTLNSMVALAEVIGRLRITIETAN